MAVSARPYTAAQAAQLLGISVDTFHRNYARLLARGMPAALLPWGPKKFAAAAFDAWLAAPKHAAHDAAANDDAPAAAPTIEQQRADLARAYGTG